jgi:hypothetical protein
MFLVGLLQWWYGRGWVSQLDLLKLRLSRTAAFFSIGQLASTLFSPFRQISVGSATGGSLSMQARAFFDKTLSRVIGAFVRIMTIFFGIIALTVSAIVEGILLIMWPVVPVFPLIGFILLAIGWAPQWI